MRKKNSVVRVFYAECDDILSRYCFALPVTSITQEIIALKNLQKKIFFIFKRIDEGSN